MTTNQAENWHNTFVYCEDLWTRFQRIFNFGHFHWRNSTPNIKIIDWVKLLTRGTLNGNNATPLGTNVVTDSIQGVHPTLAPILRKTDGANGDDQRRHAGDSFNKEDGSGNYDDATHKDGDDLEDKAEETGGDSSEDSTDATSTTSPREEYEEGKIAKFFVILLSFSVMIYDVLSPFAFPTPECAKCLTDIPILRFSISNRICNGSAKDCKIPPNGTFWLEKNLKDKKTEYAVCDPCFKSSGESESHWKSDINESKDVKKSRKCTTCKRLYHHCCTLYDFRQFVCEDCTLSKPDKRQWSYKKFLNEKKVSLNSQFIEDRVNGLLQDPDSKIAAPGNAKISVRTIWKDVAVPTRDMVPSLYLKDFEKKYGIIIKYRSWGLYVYQRQEEGNQLFMIIFGQEYDKFCKKSYRNFREATCDLHPARYRLQNARLANAIKKYTQLLLQFFGKQTGPMEMIKGDILDQAHFDLITQEADFREKKI